ncbi:MAG TPA: hypothetical protein VFK10_09475, partial [Burkholderiaceae bacterium]|nr:hypothetical protein [Burkholderiaceae bacterium]
QRLAAHEVHDRLARQHAARLRGERRKQRELVRRECAQLAVDAHRARAAIEDDPKTPKRLLTVRGVGYVFARKQDADA